ncbi:S8 family serine peptidase [Actinoplanes sp. TBRC 11911]|uniref:S8 family peptidase n=1 Tax=Actinoplanes sp. TBRC 11911 TaxID=2729386 RepID=UPI00145F9E83|nr:S8 family serine peptidase [Actinoplanes sp. TBRC 11911]NMO52659.1 S8 family serine peptidase [Actinoplanes sp. TBRC 11911]
MHLSPRRAAAATALAVLLLAAAASPARAATTEAPETIPTAGKTITLITGDVVTVRTSGSGTTVSTVGPDGRPATVHVVQTKSGLYVYPMSALRSVADGVLDSNLFNVTELLADGYDDAHAPQLPLIVQYQPSSSLRAVAPTGLTQVRPLDAIHGAAVTQDRTRATAFWSGAGFASNGGGAIAKVWLDKKVRASLADSTAQIGAPQVWARGDTGAGVTVAVLDTGIDSTHPDLADRIAGTASFVPGSDVTDRFGHGTHVASTIAGTGAASGGAERGVAPGARLDVGKVLGDDGSGQDSWVIAGMQWAAVDRQAKIINMSLGDDAATDGHDPVSEALNALSRQTGALFVVAAGNLGSVSSIGAPAAADEALTVGAVDGDDQLAYFSSQGPRLSDQAIKPEITAPGVDVLAARSQFTEGDGPYVSLSGTSMATPHVAGTAALVLAAHPGLTGTQLKNELVSTSKPTPQLNPWQGGTGRVDADAAERATVFATGTVSAGAKTITYTNTGTQPVALTLSAVGGFYDLGQTRITVPAGGTTDVAVSYSDTSVNRSGFVTATDDAKNVVARTAVATGPVKAYHKMTLKLSDRNGNPTPGVVELISQDYGWEPMFVTLEGETTMLLPDGYYSALSFLEVSGAHGPNSLGMAMVGDPEVDLTRDTTVRLDASKARRITTTVPQTTTDSYARLDYYRSMDEGFYRSFVEAGVRYDSLWAQPSDAKVTHGDFYFTARWRKEAPELSVASPAHRYDDVIRQAGETQLPDGTYRLTAVDAGDGTDFTGLDVKGKVAVVRHGDDSAQAAAAAKAGAKLLLVVNDEPGRAIRNYGPSFGSRTPIEVALVSQDEGNRLLDEMRHRRTTLTVTSTVMSDYVYDIAQTYHDQVPRDLTRHETPATLAKIPVDFTQPRPSVGGEFRFDWPAYNEGWGIGALSSRPLPEHRTDWVSTGGPYRWGQEVYVQGLTYQIDQRTAYAPGPSPEEVYFGPIARPHLNNNYRPPARTGDSITVDVPGWGDQDHVGLTQNAATQTIAVYQGTTLLGQSNGTFTTVTAPGSDKRSYRVVVHTDQDPAAGPLSLRTDTEWRFTSAGTTSATVLPLLQLEYALKGDHVDVSAKHLPDAAGAGRVTNVTYQLSYDDGAHWTSAKPPRSARYASIRATATDTNGNSVTQTVIRAFKL